MKNFKLLLFLSIFILSIYSCSEEEIPEIEEDIQEIEEPTVIDKSENRHQMGSWGPQILTDAEYKSLLIEIGYVEGFKPKDEALEKLKEFLEARVNKPDGINYVLHSVPSTNKAPFDREDWESIEDEYRENYNSEEELAIWIYFADGGKDDGNGGVANALGTAYKNTSMIIYSKELNDWYSDKNISIGLAEANIMGHEFGHLFGLVDEGISPVSNHTDPDNAGHCVTENCLMASGKNYSYNQQNMFLLDDYCIEDLRSIGGK
jgi:hypothetical protein